MPINGCYSNKDSIRYSVPSNESTLYHLQDSFVKNANQNLMKILYLINNLHKIQETGEHVKLNYRDSISKIHIV